MYAARGKALNFYGQKTKQCSVQQDGLLEHSHMVDILLTTPAGAVIGSDDGAQRMISKRRTGDGSRWCVTREGAADGGGRALLTP